MQSVDAIERLAESRERFLSFVSRRLANPELAEDVVQASLTKAVESFDTLRNEDALLPWFYTILRNELTNAYRVRAGRPEVELPDDFDVPEDSEEERRLCECFAALLPTLKPEYAELIDSLDLKGETPDAAAARIGITAGNLKVRRHRARQALRRRLEETCRVCAEHHCLDCTCQGIT